jgi:hypothetical protein
VVAEKVLDYQVADVDGNLIRIQDIIEKEMTLFVFLRHFG